MAKKKKTTSQSSFNPARFRQGEEASMVGVPEQAPATPVVDEQTKFQESRAQATAAEELSAAEKAALLKKQREDEYFAAQNKAKGQKPEDPPADDQFTYEYVWRQDVGGPGGKWVLTKTPNAGPADWKFDSNGMLFYKGKAYTGNYQGVNYVDGKGPGYKETGSGGNKTPTGTDPALAGLLQQLQQQNLASSLAAQAEADRRSAAAQAERQSAYDLLYQQFSQYGLGALVEPLKGFITSGINPSEFSIRLRETDAYKKRFAANAARVAKGLRALSEAEYIGLEDQYQNVMRNYGLPASYYTRGDMGRQEGFEKFISSDVSPVELEDRIQTAQTRVFDANPEVSMNLRRFYPGITNGDILAYALDPEKALTEIKRKVTAAEIGAGATMANLATDVTRAEELARYGVTKESARQGFQTIAEVLPRGSQLASIYKQEPYTQTTAEQEVFGLTGATEAGKKRRKLSELEQASFSGSSGMAGGALARDRAGAF